MVYGLLKLAKLFSKDDFEYSFDRAKYKRYLPLTDEHEERLKAIGLDIITKLKMVRTSS